MKTVFVTCCQERSSAQNTGLAQVGLGARHHNEQKLQLEQFYEKHSLKCSKYFCSGHFICLRVAYIRL